MGGAILAGLARSAVAESLIATNRSADKAAAVAGEGIRSIALSEQADGNRTAAGAAEIVLLGVKPAMIADLAREIAPALTPGTIVVSLAAGIRTGAIEALLPDAVAVVRAMPNTPSLVGLGVTGIAAGSRASDEQVRLAARVFEQVGDVLVIDEEQIDALSAISGSGPAYVFLLIEELTAAAERLGFTPADAATMVQGTFRGASELLAAGDVEPAQLRRRVTSPKGTTEQAIGALQQADLGALFDRATAAAIARARELADA